MRTLLFSLIFYSCINANPKGGSIKAGTALFEENGKTLSIRTEGRSIIDWKQFSIDEGEITRFIQPSSDMAVLNRVKGGDISRILGRLESNGHLYLINPQGIFIGASGFIQTAGFFASTWDVMDAHFLEGRPLIFKGDSQTAIVNYGKIVTKDGPIGLIGYQVENHGTLDGGEVLLKVGEERILIRSTEKVSEDVENVYSYAIRHEGNIRASRAVITAETGRVVIGGGCKAGEVMIQGHEVVLSPTSSLEGDMVIAKAQTEIAALGALHSEGGFIEISGSTFTFNPTSISTTSVSGKVGMLLLDPNDIVIQAALATSGGFSNPYSGIGFNPANLKISDLVTALGASNVTVQTSAATPGGTGLITIQDPFSWASNQSLFINAQSHVNVNGLVQCSGAGGISVTAGGNINVIATVNPVGFALTGGNITLSCPGDLTLQAGTGAGATALVTTDSGQISVSANNVFLTGGSVNPNLYAEMSSRLGPVIFPSIAGNLNVVGGSTQGSYAQIGKGAVTGAVTTVTSPITFTSIGGNVVVKGGTGSSAYAQIGHAPFGGGGNIAVSGAITFPTNGVGGSVTVQGQTGLLATAIIGHGNEGSTTVTSVIGPIDVRAQQGVNLSGGSVAQTHAIIGYHSPRTGGTVPFVSNTNNNINVQSTLINGVNLTAGTGSNSVVGYYNDGVVGSAVNVSIHQISVQTPSSAFNVSLTGGNQGAVSAGVAAIGTYVNPNLPSNSSTSNIAITAGSVLLQGGGGGNNGAARILNNAPSQTGAFDITMALGSDLQAMGGLGSGFADIYSSHNLTMTIGRDLLVNNTFQNGYAHVVASNNIVINTTIPGRNLTVIGGTTAAADGLIQAIGGAVQVGTSFSQGFTAISVGDQLMQAPAQIVGGAGASILNGVTNFTLQGGSLGAGTALVNSSAQIRTTTGLLHLIGGGRLTMTGGGSPFSYCEISSIGGDITLNIDSNITLEGGQGNNAYAQIGKGNTAIDGALSIQSAITLNSTGGSLTLRGSSAGMNGVAAYPQIGHAPFGAAGQVTVGGDVTVDVLGPTQLNAGNNTNVTAVIGHGNEITTTLTTCNGSISLTNNSQGIALNAGTGTHTHAIVGFHSPTSGSSLNCTSPTVAATSNAGDIILNATNMNNATIGYYNEAAPAGVSLTINNLTVNASGSNNITLNAGNDGGSLAGVAAIGTVATAASTAQSNIAINATNGTLTLQGPLGMNNGRARVINCQNSPIPLSATFDIGITAQNVVVVGGTAVPLLGQPYGYADMYSCRNLTMTFLQNLTVNTVTQTGYAHIVGYQNCYLNNNGAGVTAQVIGGIRPTPGGSDPGADALVEALNGQVGIGQFGPGANDIFIGDAASLAISRVVAVLDSNFVAARNNITVQGGAGPDVVALIQNTSGSTYVNAGNNLSFTGGTGGDRASAEIRSDSGSITVSASGNVSLTGGGNMMMSNDLCFAQIASNTGNIEFTSIGNNLVLTGGYGTHNYAQIGKGVANGVVNVQSNISFDNIGGNVVLQGQSVGTTGLSSYAQIGHSPFGGMMSVAVSGDITLSQVGGAINLNSSNNTNTTAVIGHGNELTSEVSSINGNIFVQDTGTGITLTPGTVPTTHAVIGFMSPDGGEMVPLSVTSSQLSVGSETGPITLNGGNGVNAVIGYYNDTTPPTVSVNITNLAVQTDPQFGTVNVLAGSNAGVAVIGTVVKPGGMNVSQSNIQITTGNLNVLGPNGANNGLALVTNNQLGVSTIGSATYDVTLNLYNGTILGGVGGTMGFAEIYSSRLLNLDYQNSFNINFNPANPTQLQTKNALVTAASDIKMNPSGSQGDFTVLGGANPAVISQMNSTQGNILGGNYGLLPGFKNMTIGRADMLGSARVFTSTGNIQLQGSGTVLVQGGGAMAELSAATSMQILEKYSGLGDVIVQSGHGGVGRIIGGTNVSVTADRNIGILGNGSQAAFITGNGNSVNLMANSNISMGTNSFLINNGPGTLTAIAGIDILLTSNAFVGATSDLTLVVDNRFPSPPQIGNGRFVKNQQAQVASAGGSVKIYTARQPFNQIQGQINGVTYTPGPEFIDTITEKWAIYYPNGSGGHPFTIFYKGPDVIPPSVLVPSTVSSAFSEMIFDLQSYDDALYFPLCFKIGYRTLYEKPAGSLSSFDLIPETCYFMIRKYYKNYNLKRIDPLK